MALSKSQPRFHAKHPLKRPKPNLSGSLQTSINYLCAKFGDFFTKCSIFHISARLITFTLVLREQRKEFKN